MNSMTIAHAGAQTAVSVDEMTLTSEPGTSINESLLNHGRQLRQA